MILCLKGCDAPELLGPDVPAKAELLLFLFADGFTFRARPDVQMKVALVDMSGNLFPLQGELPTHTLSNLHLGTFVPSPIMATHLLPCCQMELRH